MSIQLVWDKKIKILLQWVSTIIQLLMIPVLHSRQKQEPLPLSETTEIHTGCICRCCWGLPAGCQSPVWCSAGTEASSTLCHLSQYQPVQIHTRAHTHTNTQTRCLSVQERERDQGFEIVLTEQIEHLVQLFPEPVRVCKNSTCCWAKSNIHCPLKRKNI